MGKLSDYTVEALLDHFFGKAVFESPTIYLAASLEDPGPDGAGLTEPEASDYERIEAGPPFWVRNGNEVTNAQQVSFSQAEETWGEVTHLALLDAAQGGKVLASAPLVSSALVQAGDELRFPEGDVMLTLE